MTERQQNLLKNIVEQYIKKAQPIGSEDLTKESGIRVSSATIRNEMSFLIKQGYLFQPHISAGRAPTIKGFQYYIDKILASVQEKSIFQIKPKLFKIDKQNFREQIKGIAKHLTELTKELALVAFNENDFYYTGLTNLFSQPELKEQKLVFNLSRVIDQLDKISANLYKSFGNDTQVLIGEKNPFGNFCGAIFTRSVKHKVLIGILGPLRMDFKKDLIIINQIKKLIDL
jgi:transcriptional regulator of heat shock response